MQSKLLLSSYQSVQCLLTQFMKAYAANAKAHETQKIYVPWLSVCPATI